MSPRFRKDGKWWVVPPGVDKKHALPEGWGAVFHTFEDDPKPTASRKNLARLVSELQTAAHRVLEAEPSIRTGPRLRAAMESRADMRAALAFSDNATVDRLLAGMVKIYKLGRSAK